MAHPYQKHREGTASKARVKHILKADGGAIDEGVDVRQKDEMPTSYGPYGLGQFLEHEKSVQDLKESSAGTRFYDTGTRIPGRQKAKNDAYGAKLNKRN